MPQPHQLAGTGGIAAAGRGAYRDVMARIEAVRTPGLVARLGFWLARRHTIVVTVTGYEY